ncbi:hypothetical protein C8J56DRAFT_895448 [Mycena floridula]|nr:hypothetical protein C8J56DRAFT_895448 [Mycena floridula]
MENTPGAQMNQYLLQTLTLGTWTYYKGLAEELYRTDPRRWHTKEAHEKLYKKAAIMYPPEDNNQHQQAYSLQPQYQQPQYPQVQYPQAQYPQTQANQPAPLSYDHSQSHALQGQQYLGYNQGQAGGSSYLTGGGYSGRPASHSGYSQAQQRNDPVIYYDFRTPSVGVIPQTPEQYAEQRRLETVCSYQDCGRVIHIPNTPQEYGIEYCNCQILGRPTHSRQAWSYYKNLVIGTHTYIYPVDSEPESWGRMVKVSDERVRRVLKFATSLEDLNQSEGDQRKSMKIVTKYSIMFTEWICTNSCCKAPKGINPAGWGTFFIIMSHPHTWVVPSTDARVPEL